jgi:hypothetical protein
MALSPLLDFLKAAAGYIRPETTDLEEFDAAESQAVRYHRRVVVSGGVGGIILTIAGTTGVVLEGWRKNELALLLMMPFLSGVAGILLGVAGACLFAPREFLTGPVGRKWMALIGTKSVFVARIVCAILFLGGLGALTALTVMAALGK